jgi:hypothetical protein
LLLSVISGGGSPILIAVVVIEVFVRVLLGVMLLQVLLGDEELWTLLALEIFLLLASGQLQKILICSQGLLLQFEFLLENLVLVALLFDLLSDFGSLLV